MIAPYAFRLARQSIFRDKWINLLSILTIAAALLIISVCVFIIYNVEAFTRRLPERVSVIVYLDDNLPREKTDQIAAALRSKRVVTSVKYVSREEAFKELKAALKNADYVLEGLEENPLPDSLELRIARSAADAVTVRRLAEEIGKMKGVNDVAYGEAFLAAFQDFKNIVKLVVAAWVAILAAGITFVCYSTVKILFYRRNEEIETFKLLGATKGFIRAPFLIEGAVIGAGGGLVSFLGVLSFHYLFLRRLGPGIPLLRSIVFPEVFFLPLPLVGLLLGIAGAALALGRLKY